MRFLHLADLHLDAAFQSRSRSVREGLRAASRQAMSSAIDVAVTRRLDAVLIAGDLFDGERLSIQTERFLSEELSRLVEAKIHLVYATGNHDPGEAADVIRALERPELITVASGPDPVRVAIDRDGETVGWVTAAGHAEARVTEDLSSRFPPPSGPQPEVGLLHTQVAGASGADGHKPYAPSQLRRLTRAGFDYWALGHVHTRQELSGIPGVYYSGNTQGRNPRETGPRGGLFIEVGADKLVRPEFLELGPVRWETLRVDGLQDTEDLNQVADRIEATWEETRSTDRGIEGGQWLLRIELAGPTRLHRDWTSPGALQELADVVGAALDLLDIEIRAGGLTPDVEVEEYAKREDILGEALRLVTTLSALDGPSPRVELGLGYDDLLGLEEADDHVLDDYLRKMLEGGDIAVLDALLELGSDS